MVSQWPESQWPYDEELVRTVWSCIRLGATNRGSSCNHCESCEAFLSARLTISQATFSCPNGDELCDLLRGDLALAWFNVFLASILFWPSLIIVARRKSWNEKHFDTWGRHVFGMELKDRDDWGRRGQIKRARERQERTLVEERTVIDGRDEPIRAV